MITKSERLPLNSRILMNKEFCEVFLHKKEERLQGIHGYLLLNSGNTITFTFYPVDASSAPSSVEINRMSPVFCKWLPVGNILGEVSCFR